MSTITATVSTTISPLPSVLDHADIVDIATQDQFTTEWEAFNTALSGTTIAQINAVGDQIDLVASQMNIVAGEVNTNAGIASAAAVSAAADAATAANFAGAFVGTSTTSVTIGTGSKSFTTQANEQYTAGIFMTISSQADVSNKMFGEVTAYNSTTGALTINVTQTWGSGTFADWNVSLSGPVGATGATFTGGSLTSALNEARATVASHATTADIWGALGNQIDFTGTATVTAFPSAPQAGATRELICAGACSFTAGANMIIDGVPSGTVTCAAGDIVKVRALSTTVFKLTRQKADGTPQVTPSTSVGDHSVYVTGGNGYGSTNTLIPRFTTVNINVGTDITYADSATLGASFTINTSGLYAIEYLGYQSNTGSFIGISVNSTQLTTSIASISSANRIAISQLPSGTTGNLFVSTVERFEINDVVRPHVNIASGSASIFEWFKITRIGG